MKKVKKLKLGQGPRFQQMIVFMTAFAVIGGLIILGLRAAPGGCATSDTIGSATYTVTAPETTTYRIWVRMQVPDTTNTNNTNGVKIELDGNQCFKATTTASNAVNQWQWVNSDATAASTINTTTQITAGSHTIKLLGMKAGVKVDKVLLLKSDNTCTPSNDLTNGSPGDNCTVDAPVVTLSANPTSLTSGGSTTLTWTATDASSCTASGGTGWSGAKNAVGGNQTISNLTSNQTFTLNCNGTGGSGSASASVTVTAPAAPTVTFSANPTTVTTGNPTTLTWSSTNATSCTASGGTGWSGTKATSGSQSSGNLTSNQTFNISCTGPGGNASRSATVTVTATPPPTDTTPPAVTFTIPGVTLGAQTSVRVNNLKEITWQPLASDTSGVKTLVLTVNGQPATLSGGSVKVGTTANGDYVLRAVATDNANNVSTTTVTIKLRHADFDRSGTVGLRDLTLLLSAWDQASAIYDINDSGKVDLFDLTYVLNKWNSTE